jgi:ribose 5-phosphate isomerase A
MARNLVARQMIALGGRPVWREGFTTDNGNCILDVHDLDLTDPVAMEQTINNLAGVVTCGLFALRPADLVLCATQDGIRQV